MTDAPLDPVQHPTRRAVLGAGGLGLGVAALAACGAKSTPAQDAGTSTQASTAPGTGPGSTSAAAPPATATTSTSGTGAPGAVLIALAKVPVGGSARATLNGQPVLVARPTATTAVAHTAICTHMQCPLPAGAKIIECTCHFSRFNTFTGAVVRGPATRPLAAIKVKVEDGNVVADS